MKANLNDCSHGCSSWLDQQYGCIRSPGMLASNLDLGTVALAVAQESAF